MRFRNLLSDLSGERIVILSTHIVSDVESTATEIAILHKGHLKVHARPEQLLKQMDGSVWEWMVDSEELPALKQQILVTGTLRRMDGIEVRAVSADAAQPGSPAGDAQPGGCVPGDGGAEPPRSSGMNTVRIIYHLALADFYERTRRYSFVLILAAVIYMGVLVNNGTLFLSLGPSNPTQLSSSYRGEFNSAWTGTMTVLVLNGFLGLFGFYLVSDCIKRDIRTGVGQIIATTPVSRAVYLIGKWISNCLVLYVLVLILAIAAVIMVLLNSDAALDLGALLIPFLAVALPYMALTAALAVVFDTLPWLRGTVGNAIYFFLWMFLFLSATKGEIVLPLLKDPLGVDVFRASSTRGPPRPFPTIRLAQWASQASSTLNIRSSIGLGWPGPRASSLGVGCGRSSAWG